MANRETPSAQWAAGWRAIMALCALAIVLGITLGASRSVAASETPRGEAPRSTTFLQQADAATELVEKHSPIVYIGQQSGSCDDGGEAFEPSGVEMVLDREGVIFKRGESGEHVTDTPGAADLYQADKEHFIDLPGDPAKPDCTYEQFFRDGPEEAKSVTYARVVQTSNDEGPAVVVQYWFYYVFNDWNNTHESDFEFIQLVWKTDSVAEALTRNPDVLGYSQHSSGERATWDDGKLQKEDTHPIVYVARGSHANQYRADLLVGKGEEGSGFGCDDSRQPMSRLDMEVRLLPDSASGPDDPFAWITYEGRWGERRSGELNGPTGPNTKLPWKEPLTWQDGTRDEAVTVPEWNGPGVSATDAFCGIVKWGSKAFVRGGIWLLVGILGMVGVATYATLSRTSFRPATVQPLRIRRRFGQILAAAARTELRLWRLFLGIGVVFIPIGLLTLALQEVIFRYTPVGDVKDVADSRLADAVLALTLGAVQFGITYWLTLCVVVAALHRVAAGESVTAIQAFKDFGSHAGSLAKSRGLAFLAVALLTLSIVGIPVAILLGTRWLFLEQAILIEGADAKQSRKRSRELVHGHYVYVLAVIIGIAGLGLFTGPVFGAFMVLLSSASLTAINIVSAIFYTALVPWVGIAFTMLYWSMSLEHDEKADADVNEADLNQMEELS